MMTMATFETIHLMETDSTNRWAADHDDGRDLVVWTDYQTAGRGCDTNTWESERDMNLLFSVLCHPRHVAVNRQYLLTVAMALAVKRVMDSYTPDEPLTVKWPNDLYWRDGKLGGILAECVLTAGRMKRCIIGVGLNLNQRCFLSDAPNPVSMTQICGETLSREVVLQSIMDRFAHYLELLETGNEAPVLDEYRQALYRREGYHAYRDGSGPFEAELVTVEDDGHLVLRDNEGQLRRYAFKEVSFVIPPFIYNNV